MLATTIREEAGLIAVAGDAEDALDLSRRLIRNNQVKSAVAIRRTVAKGVLDRDALLKAGEAILAEAVAQQAWAQGEFRTVARQMVRSGNRTFADLGREALRIA